MNSGVGEDQAKRRLAHLKGVRVLDPDEEPFDMNSVRSLDRKIDHLTKGDEVRGGDNEGGVDYLGFYRDFLKKHAFPNDTYNWRSLERAQAHANLMPKAKLRNVGPFSPMDSQSWQFVGPTNLQAANAICFGIGPVNGRINAVAFDPKTPTTIYAGAAQGGLWRSTNAGATWTWLSSTWSQLAVNCIAIDPMNSNIIFVGLGDYHGHLWGCHGIEWSTDGGQTWSLIDPAIFRKNGVASLLIDPTNDQTIIAGTGDYAAGDDLYRSTDGGVSWTELNQNTYNCRFSTLAATAPVNGNTRFYALAAGIPDSSISTLSRLIYSDDHGKSWQSQACPIQDSANGYWAYSVATSPTNSQNVYILDSQNMKLYTSVNQGKNWTDQSANLPTGGKLHGSDNYNFSQSWYDFNLGCGNRVVKSSNTDILYLSEIDIQESDDQGKTWNSVGGPSWLTQSQGAITHNDQHAFAMCLTNPNLMLFSNDGGIYQLSWDSNKQKNSITSLNKYLANSMFYKIACHPTDPNYLIGGAQDNATPFATGDLGNWGNTCAGDGGGCAINQQNPLISYATDENLGMIRTDDGWKTWKDISPPVPAGENLPFVATVVLNPFDQTKLYTGTNHFWIYDDTSNQWTEGPEVGLSDGTVTAIAVAPSDQNRIYCGASNGVLTTSADGGTTFRFVPPPITAGITSISVNPTNPNDIVIGFSSSGIKHLWRCTNTAGPFQYPWTPVTGSGTTSLPDSSLNSFARDLDDPQNTWYVAMDAGVFQTTDGGTTWANMGTAFGLPPVLAHDLVAVPGTRYLNLGTFGRGWWRIYLPAGGANLNGLTISPNPVVGGLTTVGSVTLSKPAPSSGTTIQLKVDSSISAPSSITVPSGATTASFQISTSVVSSDATATITATEISISKSQTLTIKAPVLQSVGAVTNPVVGGMSATGEVLLTGNAPTGGIKVTLSSSQANVKVPATVTVAAGSSVAAFTITASTVGADLSTMITAKAGSVTQTGTFYVRAASLQGMTLSSSPVVGGSEMACTGILTFNGPTPSAGLAVQLSSTDKTVVVLPTSITAKPTSSQLTVSFAVKHLLVRSSQTVTITATANHHSVFANLQVDPFAIASISLNPSSVAGGDKSTGTIILNAMPGPNSGAITVTLTQSGAKVALPANAKVPVDIGSGSFTVTTSAVPSDTLSFIKGAVGTSSQHATLSIKAPVLVRVTVKPTTVKGSASTVVTGTVGIGSPAPAGGVVISLGTSDTNVATTPANVTIRAGQKTATFAVTHHKVGSTVTLTVGATLGSVTVTTPLTVTR
ncbi:MAG: hypothetical protein P4L46_26030 [Fimbriimonas sp.]|nr:hypothetical protein [Fimbriimonas sp.]